MKNIGKHITILALLATFCCSTANAEGFADFLLHFLAKPEAQGKFATPSLTIDGKKAGHKGNYIHMANTSTVAMLCADSINTPSLLKGEQKASMVDLVNKDCRTYNFSANGKSYLLSKATSNTNEDYEFIAFLSEYTRNHDLQMKRTIFPFPIRSFKNGKEGSSKLLMPREWNYLNFNTICPQIAVLKNVSEANNRRIYIYNENKIKQIYNFICINRKWYLIEVENHQ